MWTITELKEKGKAAFRANYWPSVLVAFLLMLFTGSLTVASRSNNQNSDTISSQLQKASPVVLFTIAGISVSVIVITLILRIFLFNPLNLGCYGFFIENLDQPAELGVIKNGFRNYGNVFITLLVKDIFLFLWTILFVIPGIIKSYSYRMVPYILAEDPTLSPMECITRSKEMMQGQKWKTFVLDLSFLGWELLSLITVGIVGIFWTNPYKESTDAALYERLR